MKEGERGKRRRRIETEREREREIVEPAGAGRKK
jgi:hypothetical protein